MAEGINNKKVTVGTSPVVIAEELLPTQRKEIFITNTSTAGQVITISVGTDAIAGYGLVLNPGGCFSSSADGNKFYPIFYHFSAVSDAVGGTLAILERVGDKEK